MNILLHDFGSFIQPDLIACLSEMGHHCKNIIYPLPDPTDDAYFEKYITAHLNTGHYDCVISTNFQPLLARICYQCNIKYISWSYDSPLSKGYKDHYAYPTNYLFLFDRMEAEDFRREGLQNVYHLPLAVNTKRLSAIPISTEDRERFSCDLSFVGKIYKSPLKRILSHQDDYTIGYINALTDAQFKLPGIPLPDDIIDDTLLRHMNDTLAKDGIIYRTDEGNGITKAALTLCINNQITRNERIILLRLMNRFCNVHFHSGERVEQLSEVPFLGPVTYSVEMPKVFRLSRINLCPALRGIRSGIPLRAIDIMGSGGFILCSPQPELADYFRPDTDIVCYQSIEDAVEKAKFYLTHENQRIRIAQNAYSIIQNHFTYPERLSYIFQTVGL